MAIANLDGDRVYYRLEGAAGQPVVALSHSLGLDHTMWDPQIAALTRAVPRPALRPARPRRQRRDARRLHGRTARPRRARPARSARLDRVAWCGVSLGGMVGQWLAAHAGDRLRTSCSRTPRRASPIPPAWRRGGAPCSTAGPARSWTPRWRASSRGSSPPIRRGSRRRARRSSPPIRRLRRLLRGVARLRRHGAAAADRARTLVVSGDADVSMPWEAHGAALAAAIPGARWCGWRPRTPRTWCCREPSRGRCSSSCGRRPRDPFEAGLDVRRAVLGDDYVAAGWPRPPS